MNNQALPCIQGEVEFILDLPCYHIEKPYYIAGLLEIDEESRRTNAVFETKIVDFQDVRGTEQSYNLDQDGFTYIANELTLFNGLSTVNKPKLRQYADDTLRLMKRLYNTDDCWVYAYKFRSSADVHRPTGAPTGDAELPDEPAVKAHIDQTLDGGFRRIRRHLTSEEQRYYLDQTPGKWRFLIVNTWRPINQPVVDYPLAICHPKSMSIVEDTIATDRVSDEFLGENYYLKFRHEYQWYWLSNQRPDELLVFVSFDSVQNLQNSFVPHCSFKLPDLPDGGPVRESIETRTIVALPMA